MPAPLRQAVSEDQMVVGKPEQDGQMRVAIDLHHMWPTSSGIS